MRRGNVDNRLWGYGKRHSQHMEKLKCSFPTSCKQRFPQPQKSSQLPTFPHRRLLRKKTLSYLSFIKKDFKEMIGNQGRKHGLHDTRPYSLGTQHTAAGAAHLQLNTAAPQKLRGVGTPPLPQGGFFMRRRQRRPPLSACRTAAQRQKGFYHGIF